MATEQLENTGGNSGSREPDPSFTGSGPSGFDPGRSDFTIKDVLQWARTKPADERYDFTDANECAIAQYGMATGRAYLVGIGRPSKSYPDLERLVNPDHSAPEYPRDYQTFGKLVERIEKLCPETIVKPSEWTRLDAYLLDIETVSA